MDVGISQSADIRLKSKQTECIRVHIWSDVADKIADQKKLQKAVKKMQKGVDKVGGSVVIY